MSARLFLVLVGILAALVLVQRGLSWSIPGYAVLAPGLLLLAALVYVPVLISSVRDGEISVPPQTVLRHHKPVLFWTVVATHAVFTAATAVGTAAHLLGWLG